jgi:2-polyprenyl-6-methoxyphenol hydroxylase-like FAD-dependent oxidoreductase
VVGGGPVGLGLAIDLGLRGVSVALVEGEEQLHRIPKGQNLTQRTMEHFRLWGVEDRIRAARVLPTGYPTGGVTAYRDLIGPYSYQWFHRGRVGAYYFCANERLPQYRTEAVLRDRVAELGTVEALYGWHATGLRQGTDEVEVEITADGMTRRLSADFVVGCDGSHSFVREAAGIGEERSDHARRMILIVLVSPELHGLLERFGDASIFNVLHPDLDGYWRFLGRVDVGRTFFFHAPVPASTTLEDDDLIAVLHDAVGVAFAADIEYAGFWDLRIAVADRYRNGRVLIAGDAAHSHPPYGGYGINTGLEDARNLGWKLAAALEGWGSEALLDSYGEERRPVFVATARDFIEAFIDEDRDFVAKHDPERDRADFEAAWERRSRSDRGVTDFAPHYEGSPIVDGAHGGVSGARALHRFTAVAGHHLAPVTLSGERDLFTELGRTFALVALGDVEVGGFVGAAASLGVPLAVIRDTLDASRKAYGASMVLVRPDHYIAWVGDDAAVPEVVLRRAIGG